MADSETTLATTEVSVIALGTAGGPIWWQPSRQGNTRGISTALVIGEEFYIIDAGSGAAQTIAETGLKPQNLRGIFLTHLHSDHVVDLSSILLFSCVAMRDKVPSPAIPVIGPPSRGTLPTQPSYSKDNVEPAFPDNPLPGTKDTIALLLNAHASDINDRIINALKVNPVTAFDAREIEVPHTSGFDPDTNFVPDMKPFHVYADELVSVSAVLVNHPPMSPAFAFRFETKTERPVSVTISGDTAPTDNLVALAQNTDLLLHEAIDFNWVQESYLPKTAVPTPDQRASADHHHRSHTSPIQAGEIASKAGAKVLGLHHLVPANADPQIWQSARTSFAGALWVPQDGERHVLQAALPDSPISLVGAQ